MKIKSLMLALTATLFLSVGSAFATEKSPKIGVVNFTKCITESKYGMREQESFDSLKNQMTSVLQEVESQLKDLSAKFQDPEYLDSLSPEAEKELKNQFQGLSEEMNRHQAQYYQIMNQAQMKLVQSVTGYIHTASKHVAKKNNIGTIINKDALYYFKDADDVTSLIITEMNKDFDLQNKETITSDGEKPAE